MSFTPGEWLYDEEITWVNGPGEQEQHGDYIIYPKEDEDLVIAEVNRQIPEGQDNVRLLTAAKELYAALPEPEELRGLFLVEPTDRDMVNEWADRVEAARAKAEGRG